MNEKKHIIYKGAEAEIKLETYMGHTVILKKRIPKSYRIKQLDSFLISTRTKEETKLMTESRLYGVSIPIIYDVDLKNGVITMEHLQGRRVKDILDKLDEPKRVRICREIGIAIARLHNNNIIHGDITTSNMILMDDRIHFIDFGLGEKNSEIEAKGVDLHVLKEAIDSTHPRYSYCFKHVLEGYSMELHFDADRIVKKINEIEKRGRYR